MTNIHDLKKKIYLSLGIAALIGLITSLVIWHQFGNPAADTAATDVDTSLAQQPTPTPTISQDVQSGLVQYPGQSGFTALQLLQQLHPTTITHGDGINTAVDTIDGQPAPDQQKLWVFYLNGQPATTSAYSYQTQDTDQIQWRLQEY